MRNTPVTNASTSDGELRIPLWAQRRLAGIDNAHRLHELAERLRHDGSIAVAHSRWGTFGDRHTLWLNDGTALRMKLIWVTKEHLAALTHVWFNEYVGWMARGRNTAGDVITLAAWQATLTTPATAPTYY